MTGDITNLINQQKNGMEYGTIVAFIKVHDGEINTVDMQKMFTHKTRRGNEEALEAVVSLLKGIKAARETGNLTFTIDFSGGDATKLIVQDMKRWSNKT